MTVANRLQTSTAVEPRPVPAAERKLGEEIDKIPYEPLLPAEKKLIIACLSLGITLLALLALASYVHVF